MRPLVGLTPAFLSLCGVSPDGRDLFCYRRVGGNGDIDQVSAKIIDELRPKDHEE